MGHQDRKVPVDELAGAIEELLRAGPRSVAEVTRALGWSTRAICPRLEQLALEDRAHRVRVRLPNTPSVCYRWHAGPAPGSAAAAGTGAAATLPQARPRVIVPYQHSVSVFAAIDRRDPLVAALFGLPPMHRTGAQ
jgi:hypothetical protein